MFLRTQVDIRLSEGHRLKALLHCHTVTAVLHPGRWRTRRATARTPHKAAPPTILCSPEHSVRLPHACLSPHVRPPSPPWSEKTDAALHRTACVYESLCVRELLHRCLCESFLCLAEHLSWRIHCRDASFLCSSSACTHATSTSGGVGVLPLPPSCRSTRQVQPLTQ